MRQSINWFLINELLSSVCISLLCPARVMKIESNVYRNSRTLEPTSRVVVKIGGCTRALCQYSAFEFSIWLRSTASIATASKPCLSVGVLNVLMTMWAYSCGPWRFCHWFCQCLYGVEDSFFAAKFFLCSELLSCKVLRVSLTYTDLIPLACRFGSLSYTLGSLTSICPP